MESTERVDLNYLKVWGYVEVIDQSRYPLSILSIFPAGPQSEEDLPTYLT